jgi:hypothetical protein
MAKNRYKKIAINIRLIIFQKFEKYFITENPLFEKYILILNI